MASNSKNPRNKPVIKNQKQVITSKPGTVKSKAVETPPASNMWDSMDKYFYRNQTLFLIISVILSVLLGGFLFDVKISTGGDDSHYIEMANDFLKGRSFPTWHGPLYSIFLSLPMLFFGVNVIWLKVFSFIFIIAQLIIFFYTFRNHISATLFTFIMLIVAVNSTILYFASQTYSEAMFMFLQSVMFFIFIKAYLNFGYEEKTPFRQEAVQWLVLGFFVFLASLTRNIGIVGLVAMLLFLLYEKKFRAAAMLLVSYLVFLIPFRIYKSIVWDSGIAQGPDQISEILRKNPYNRAMGTEDLGGMIDRFFINANSYLSKHFMVGLGLHSPTSSDKNAFVTILIVLLMVIALYFAFRNKNKIMLFTAVYLGGSMAATFIALHQSWDQMRMVVIFFPMLLMLIAWGMQQLAKQKGFKFLNLVLLLMLTLIFYKTFGITADKIKDNRKVLSKNMKGNLYYGFTPDWQNFLRMSEWVGANIPANQMVASRKPSMSYIYSKGRDFYGIYRFPSEEPETFLNTLEKRTSGLSVIANRNISAKWPYELQLAIKQANVACIAEGNELYGVYEFKGNEGNEVVKTLNEMNVKPFTVDSMIRRVNTSQQSCFAVSPDSLINNLKRNKVEYVIVASLRANPNMNTGNIINNIQRYLYFVEQKYPGILRLVHQIGTDAEEPAWLYQINYKIYGL